VGLGIAWQLVGPYVQDVQLRMWMVHYNDCTVLEEENEKLLKGGSCASPQSAELRMACDKAQKDRKWGVWVCTIDRCFSQNAVSTFLRNLWESWWTYVAFLYLAGLCIRYWFEHQTSVRKHSMDRESFIGNNRPQIEYRPQQSGSYLNLPDVQSLNSNQIQRLQLQGYSSGEPTSRRW
jgi:hypothetical protein